MHELIKLSATEIRNKLLQKEIKPTELVQISIDRINEVEPIINAMPTICLERAMEHAKKIENTMTTCKQLRSNTNKVRAYIKNSKGKTTKNNLKS